MKLDNSYSEKEELVFLKSRFLINEKNLYGVFYILFNINNNGYEKVDIIASRYRDFIEEAFPIKLWSTYSWIDLEHFITMSKIKGQYADVQTKDIHDAIDIVLKSINVSLLVLEIKKEKVTELEQEFTNIFIKAVGNCSPVFEFTFESTTYAQIESQKKDKEKLYDEQQKDIATKTVEFEQVKKQIIPGDAALINVLFVLAPISGVPIEKLNVGDRVMIKVDISDPKSNYFADILNSVKDKKANPIPAIIEKIEKTPKGGYFVLTKIQDGIYGQLTEEEPIKVQEVDNEKYKLLEKHNTKKSHDYYDPESIVMNKKDNMQLIILLSAFALIITAVLYIFFVFY